jgi:uncharacterized membrane protein (UPF0127 family)
MTGNGSDPFQLVIERSGQCLASRVTTARTITERMRGLLGRSGLPEHEALFFPNCQSIHTLGMGFAIDIVYVKRSWDVVRIAESVKPGRLLAPAWSAWGVVELAAGVSRQKGLVVGDRLRIE